MGNDNVEYQNADANFGITLCGIIKELDAILIRTMSEKGESEEEIITFFESEKYVQTYVDIVSPMLIKGFSESLGKYVLEDDDKAKQEQNLYLEHLRGTWGMGIAWMKQYCIKCVDICDGWGWYINQSHIHSERCNVFYALHAIHGKALLVYDEIICLIENGFPDGAYTHFRTLYELWAVAEFLIHDSDEVSKAFIESVDDKSDSETAHYKWACLSERFVDFIADGKKVTISKIVKEAHKTFTQGKDISHTFLNRVYTFPNKILHPSAAGVFYRTSNPANNITLIGRADTGLATPAINSSMYMFNITRIFLSTATNPASAIGINILSDIITKRIIPLFEEAEKTKGRKNNDHT